MQAMLVTDAVSLPDGGPIQDAAFLPRQDAFAGAYTAGGARKWLPLFALVGVAMVAILLGVLADEAPPGAKDTSDLAGTKRLSDATATAEPWLDAPKQEIAAVQMLEVKLTTDPEGAEVRINGVPKGLSPLTLPLQVGSRVRLRFDLDGHEALQKTIEVTADAPNQDFLLVALAADGQLETTKKSAPNKKRVIKSKKAHKQHIRDSADRRH